MGYIHVVSHHFKKSSIVTIIKRGLAYMIRVELNTEHQKKTPYKTPHLHITVNIVPNKQK